VSSLAERAETLAALHRGPDPLLLPNAWDARSARSVLAAGFPVVATTSAGVANALGYEDHEDAPSGEVFAAVARIARAAGGDGGIVTADLEAGYGLAADVLVGALLDAGAVGCNLEDSAYEHGGLRDVAAQAAWLAAVRAAASSAGVPIALNARIDVGLGSGEPEGDPVEEIVLRADAYLAAGATSVFPIALADDAAIEAVVGAVDGPVNVLLRPDGPSPARLAELGVARISLGGQLADAAAGYLDERLAALR
jgi:2-methylisocitrate lyase-like PEP mutase family enzyme